MEVEENRRKRSSCVSSSIEGGEERERERCQQEDKSRVTDESVSITWSIVFAESMMSSWFSVNNYSPTFRLSSFRSPSMTRVSLIRYVRDDNSMLSRDIAVIVGLSSRGYRSSLI